ncbi:MAG: S8 family peptidase [bacterium]|nr:S8 family peptidase [bacterium]
MSLWTRQQRPDGADPILLVGFDGPPIAAQMATLGRRCQTLHRFRLMPVVAVRRPPDQPAFNLLDVPGVSFVEENGRVFALETVPWGVERVGAPDAWPVSRGEGVNVAILDTGIARAQADLRVIGGVSFVGGGWNDANGHGTHVAGTVGGLGAASGVTGVAPGARLHAVKVLGDDGSGTWLSVARGIEWSVQNGMRVLNLSLGSPQGGRTLELACRAAADAGLVLVGAAGNSGDPAGRGNSVGYPAGYEPVIAVAASDRQNRRAPWSSTGPAVELIAPGVGILSTAPGNRYTELSGTSMACPHVAGAAALTWGANPHLRAREVRRILGETAENLGLSRNWQGHGLVRADRAVASARR